MSDIVKRYRKFCKIVGLHSIFNFDKDDVSLYYTTYLDDKKIISVEVSNQLSTTEGISTLPITKDTVIFITADSADKDKKIKILSDKLDEEGNKIKDIETTRTISEFDTMLWVNGSIYSLSQKNVRSISYNTDTNKLDIIYSDDDKESIDIVAAQTNEFIGNFPLYISDEKDNENGKDIYYYLIQLFGQDKNETGRNFVIGMYEDTLNAQEEYKNTYNGRNYTTIIGKGNIASKDGQIILGDFNESTDSKFIVCNGDSNERKNIFTISDDGRVFAKDDFVLPSNESTKITYRLSDIHDVIDEDWYKES